MDESAGLDLMKDWRLPVLKLRPLSRGIALVVFLLVGSALMIAVIALRVHQPIHLTGEVELRGIARVYAAEEGFVDSVYSRPGDLVQAGDVLVQMGREEAHLQLVEVDARIRTLGADIQRAQMIEAMDSQRLEIRVKQAQARVSAARAGLLAAATDHLGRVSVDSLIEWYVEGSAVALDIAMSGVRAAQADLKMIELERATAAAMPKDIRLVDAELSRLQSERLRIVHRYGRTTVTAPIDGLIANEGAEDMQGSHVARGTLLLEIAPSDGWEVVAHATARQARDLRLGDTVAVRVDALHAWHDAPFLGNVVQIGRTPHRGTNHQTAMYRVVIALRSDAGNHVDGQTLRRGYIARAHVIRGRQTIVEMLRNRAFAAASQ